MTDSERIAALEARLARLERENALFKHQWLDRNAYSNVREYRPRITNGPGGIPLDEQSKEFWRGDGWRGV